MTTTSATPTNSTSLSTYTYIDRSWKLDNSAAVTTVGAYSSGAVSGAKLKILKRNSAGDYNFVQEASFSHPGGGWHDVSLSFAVPSTGDYYVAGYLPSGSNGANASTARGVKSGDVTGNGSGWTEDVSGCMALRANASGGGDPPPGGPHFGLIIDGNSLHANYNGGSVRHTFRNASRIKSLDISTGIIGPAVDPFPGDGNGGTCCAAPLADLLVDNHGSDFGTLMVAVIGQGGSVSSQHVTGTLAARKTTAINQMLASGITQIFYLLHLSENEAVIASLPRSSMIADLQSICGIVLAADPDAAIFIGQGGGRYTNSVSPALAEVAAANAAVIDPSQNIFAGADYDLLGLPYRDGGGVHLAPVGNLSCSLLDEIPIALWFATH